MNEPGSNSLELYSLLHQYSVQEARLINIRRVIAAQLPNVSKLLFDYCKPLMPSLVSARFMYVSCGNIECTLSFSTRTSGVVIPVDELITRDPNLIERLKGLDAAYS